MKRRFALLIALLLMISAAGGCTTQEEDLTPLGEAYFTAITKSDYGACFNMLSTQPPEGWPSEGAPPGWPDGLTLQSFVGFYDEMLSLVRLREMRWSLAKAERLGPDDAELSYDVTYTCEYFEPFSQRVVIPLRREAVEWRILWSPQLLFEGMEWGDRLLVSNLRQKRGEILDEEANAYAVNAYADTVYVQRSLVTDLLEVSTKLSPLLGMDAAAIRELVLAKGASEDDYAVIRVFPPYSLEDQLAEQLMAVPAVGLDRAQFRPMRYYPQKDIMAHLLGYVHPVEPGFDPTRYDADSKKGYTGLEKAWEDKLAGYRGREIALVDAAGNRKHAIVRKGAQDGEDLILTIDYELQERATELLKRLPEVEAEAGAIVAINPKTGDLLAAASYPNFDNNMFSFPIPTEVFEAMMQPEAHQPLYDRVTQGLYAPGSTIKPLTAAMALQNKLVEEDYAFTGRIDWEKRQWMPDYPEWNAPAITRAQNYEGPVNMNNAITYSDNVYFAYVALKAGWGQFEPFLKNIGFEQKFPFDVPVATSKIRDGGSVTNLHLLATSGFGQGEMLITPLQMAYTFSAFANGGNIMRPRLVQEFKRMNGMEYETIETVEPQVWIEASDSAISQQSVETINPMLRRVITTGSGRPGRLRDIETLGKTGTAEIGGNKERELAWSISFVSHPDYDRLVCVILEVPTLPKEAGSFRHEVVGEMLAP